MPALVTDNFRVFAAEQFIESLEEPYDSSLNPVADESSAAAQAFRSKIYLFIGRSYNWNDTSANAIPEKYGNIGTIDEFNPPDPVDSFDELSEIYDDMIALKRVTRSDVSQVIRRRTWQANTVYDMYRNNYSPSNLSATGQSKLYDCQFYVMNSNYDVYKCIYNGQNPEYPNGKPSTVEPTGTSTSIIDSPADGYKWKYMYTLSISDYIKFVSTDFIPVKSNSTVQSAAIDGAINQVVIKQRGSSITAGTYYAPVIGDGGLGNDDTKAIVRIVVPSSGTNNQKIDIAEVFQSGSGYTYGTIDLQECYTTAAAALARNTAKTSLGTSGSIEIVISPPGGHGSNVVRELGAYRVMVHKSLDFLDGNGDIPVDMEFRRFGLISDPQTSGNQDYTANTATVCRAVKFPSTTSTNFVNGEIITQSLTGARGRVIHWDSTTKILRYYQNEYISATQTSSPTGSNPDVYKNKSIPFSGANAITGLTSNITLTPDTTSAGTVTLSGISFVTGYSASEIKKYSGQILYVENRKAVIRSNDQIEDVKLVLEF
jgi:hypothetical protein